MANQTSLLTPQTPTRPEIGPGNLVRQTTSNTIIPTREITFNQPTALAGDPERIIAEAIKGGDTIKRRAEQFSVAMLPEQK